MYSDNDVDACRLAPAPAVAPPAPAVPSAAEFAQLRAMYDLLQAQSAQQMQILAMQQQMLSAALGQPTPTAGIVPGAPTPAPIVPGTVGGFPLAPIVPAPGLLGAFPPGLSGPQPPPAP